MSSIVEGLKTHKGIKRVVFAECGITDEACTSLAELLKENHTIEELNLEKNSIGPEGLKMIADALVVNKGLTTLNLMQQNTKTFREEDVLDHFISMFHDNTTLSK